MVSDARSKLAASLAGGLVAVAGGWVLLRFPPERYGFYPGCPFHGATGLLCPGCGATRALAALLRGDFGAAWHANALLMVLAPPGLVLALRRRPVPAWTAWAGIVAAFAFAVARNGAAF